jgi:hypothetical protein
VDLNDLSTSSQQENTQKSPPRQASLCDDISSSSNLENFSELQNSSIQTSALVTKCDSYCCNSSTPYHPIRESELVLMTMDKRIGGGAWRLGRLEP